MPEVRKTEQETKKESRKVFMMAHPVWPGIAERRVWPIIMPLAQEIVDTVNGEYNLMTVAAHVVGKLNTDLFIAYELPWEGDKDPDYTQMALAIEHHLVSDNPEEGLIGYVIREWNLANASFNLWQVYIKEKYRSTDAMKQGLHWLRDDAARMGGLMMTCSTYQQEMCSGIEAVGFKRSEMPQLREGRHDFYMVLPKLEQKG